MRAHYVIIQAQGRQSPLLLPAGELPELDWTRLGFLVSGGRCELRGADWWCGGELTIGFTHLRSRQTHDAEILRRHFGPAPLEPGVPFSTRLPAEEELP